MPETPSPNPNSASSHQDGRWPIGICLVLALIVWEVFGQTVKAGFVNYDDNRYITENLIVQRGLTLHGLIWSLTYSEIGHWHPLTWLSHMLDCQWFGLQPGGHHFTNVLLHGGTVIGLFLVLRSMTGSLWRSAIVAALWAIHPLRAESVAWIAERKDVLSGLFFVLTLGAYTYYTRRPDRLRYSAVLCVFALGLLAKSILVTLPCVLLLLDYWPLRRLGEKSLPELVREKLPLFALSAASCLATVFSAEKLAETARMPLPLRLENTFISYVTYLQQTVWPLNLAAPYPNPLELFPTGVVIGAVAALFLVSAAAVVFRKKTPALFVGWFWFLGMLAPVIGLVQISSYAHADRYTYLPQIGLFIAIVWLLAELAKRYHCPRWLIATLSLLVLGFFMMIAKVQTAYWHDSGTLWSHALACTGDNFLAHNNLGIALQQAGRLDEAIPHYQEALRINPSSSETYTNLGLAYKQKGQFAAAIDLYQKALELTPDDAATCGNLALLLAAANTPSLRNGAKAEELAKKANQLTGSANPVLLVTLAAAYAEQGRFSEAIETDNIALQKATSNGQSELATLLRRHLALYQAGHPLRIGH